MARHDLKYSNSSVAFPGFYQVYRLTEWIPSFSGGEYYTTWGADELDVPVMSFKRPVFDTFAEAVEAVEERYRGRLASYVLRGRGDAADFSLRQGHKDGVIRLRIAKARTDAVCGCMDCVEAYWIRDVPTFDHDGETFPKWLKCSDCGVCHGLHQDNGGHPAHANELRHGVETMKRLLERQLCWDCDAWTERFESYQAGKLFVFPSWQAVGPSDKPYSWSPRPAYKSTYGFGGDEWLVELLDGSRCFRSCDMWSAGFVPERFRERMPVNAHRIHWHGDCPFPLDGGRAG